MTFHFGEGRGLVLAGGANAPLWIAAAIGATALLFLLYRYELRLVSRRTGRILLGTRLFVALALVATLFEPIAERRYREPVRGRVVLGVDLSESMSTADPVRSDPQRLASLSSPSPTISRQAVACRLLEGDWLKRLAEDHDVRAIGFAGEGVKGTPESLAKLLKDPSRASGDSSRLITDWNVVFDEALRDDDASPILGVVLLTDGRQNAPGDRNRGVERLSARGVPIYPILIGSTIPPKDAAVAAVKAPESVYKGDTAEVEVALKLDGIPGVEVPVVLSAPGKAPLKQIVQAPKDGSRPRANFRVPMDQAGPRELSVSVGPLFGDVRPDNDRRVVTVQVVDDKAKILLIDAEARWEFQYLRNALVRDRRVSVDSVVFRQPRFDASELSYKSVLPEASRSAEEPDPLGGYDAIVIGDVEPAHLPNDSWSRLDRYVAERGGTLILSFGARGLGGGTLGLEPVRKLLPVRDPRLASPNRQASDSTHPGLPPGATILPVEGRSVSDWPMLRLSADPIRNEAIWSSLPRQPWLLVGRAKPGATVLASLAGSELGDDGAAIVAQAYGLGKVLWLGTDATWRWRYRVGDEYHHRFWGQTVRWAVSSKPASGNDLVRFGPERSKVAIGEPIRLEARFAESVPGVGADLLATARVYERLADRGRTPRSRDEPRAIVALLPDAGRPRTFSAVAPSLPRGRYLVRLETPRLTEALGKLGVETNLEAALEIVPPQTSELVELAADRDSLERLASATGGRVFAEDQAEALPPLLLKRSVVKVRSEESTLWDRPWTLGIFFVALTVEWLARKQAGLP